MSDKGKPVSKVTGDVAEQYIETNSALLTWIKEDSLLISVEGADDIDITLTKGMAARLMKCLNMSAKMQKALVTSGEEGQEWNRFKTVFQSNAKNLSQPLVFKVSNDELVGIIPPGFERRSIRDMRKLISAAVSEDKRLQVIHEEYSHDDIVIVAEMKALSTEFMGQKFNGGIVFSYSTVGHYGPSFAPCIVPAAANKKHQYSLPTSNDNLIYYPASFAELEEDMAQFGRIAKDCVDSSLVMAGRWQEKLDKALTVHEYEQLIRNFMNAGDTAPELAMMGRLAQIYEAHGLNTDFKPSRDWLKTAWAGTTIGELFDQAFDVSVDYTYKNTPLYAVATALESEFAMDKIANNRIKALEKLTWDGA